MQPELEVALLGHESETDEWAALLGRKGWRITRFREPPSARATAGLVIAIVGPDGASATLEAVHQAFDSPAVALLVGDRHPFLDLFTALVEAKRDWEGAFDAVIDPIALLDADGSVRRANLVLARELGVPINQLVGQPIRALLGDAGGNDPLERSLRDGVARTADVRYERLPGLRQVTTSPLPGDGRSRGIVALFKDVSEQREQRERLLQASRLADVGQLAAGVAHEINTPLASIALRAEALLRKATDPALSSQPVFETFPRYLKTIEDEIFRCKKIISALLEFSRSRPPEVRETDLNALCENAVDLLRHQAHLKQIRLELKLAPGLPRLQADDAQLRQVLVALLVNAFDASPSGGLVTLETASTREEVTFSVADEGPGIPAENLDKIFTPFFSTKPIGQGTGLGLAVCHGVVAAHGGRIDVASGSGRGTRVSMVLPLAVSP